MIMRKTLKFVALKMNNEEFRAFIKDIKKKYKPDIIAIHPIGRKAGIKVYKGMISLTIGWYINDLKGHKARV